MLLTKDIITSSSPTANIPSTPSEPKSTVQPLPASPIITTSPEIVEIRRPFILTLILSLFSLYFIYKTISAIFSIISITQTSHLRHQISQLYLTSPFLCFYPLVCAVFAAFLLFLLFKSKIYTKSTHRFLLISSLIAPALYTIYNYFLPSTDSSLIFALFNESILFSLILTFCLYLLPKNFSPNSVPFSLSEVTALTLVSSLILFSTFAFTYYLIDASLHPDLNQTAIETLVARKLLYPSYLPSNLNPSSQFFINESDKKTLPEPTVDISFSSGKTTLTISQTKIGPDFDLATYQTTFTQGIAVTTPDHILVTLTNPDHLISPDNLLKISQSLR